MTINRHSGIREKFLRYECANAKHLAVENTDANSLMYILCAYVIFIAKAKKLGTRA